MNNFSEKKEFIKRMIREEKYDSIGSEVDNEIVRNLIFEEDDCLDEEDILLTLVSLYSYRQALIERDDLGDNSDFKKDNRQIKSFLLYFDDGILNLLKGNNKYFCNCFFKIIDVDYLQMCNPLVLSFLLENNYDACIDKVLLLPRMKIMRLLRQLGGTSSENLLFTSDVALKFSEEINFFKMLPDDKCNLLAYYGNDYFDGVVRDRDEEYRNNIRHLIGDKLPCLSLKEQDMVVELFGVVSGRMIDSVLKKIMSNSKYLELMEEYSYKYFGGELVDCLMFREKYCKLFERLLEVSAVSDVLKKKLAFLSREAILAGIDDLTVLELESVSLDNYLYATDKGALEAFKRQIGSIENYDEGVVLYNYSREIMRVDLNGMVECYDAKESHLVTYNEIYNSLQGEMVQDVMALVYEANIKKGDVVFATENAGLIVYFPPTLTSLQMGIVKALLERLVKVENDVYVSLGIAIEDKPKKYVELNTQGFFSPGEALEAVRRIKIDDEVQYLNELKVLGK